MAIQSTFDDREFVQVLSQAIQAARKLVRDVSIRPKTSIKKRLAMLILHQLVEKADSVRTLAESAMGTGIGIIVRSAFENYIDVTNLYKYPKVYPAYLLYLSDEQQRKGIQGIIEHPESPYSKSIVERIPKQLGMTAKQMLDLTKSHMEDCKMQLTRNFIIRKANPTDPKAKVETSVQFRAKMAGKTNEYEAVYRMLSGATHGDISSMLGGVIRDKQFKWPPNKSVPSTMAINWVTTLLLDSSKLVAGNLRRPVKHFTSVEAQQANIQQRYVDSQ